MLPKGVSHKSEQISIAFTANFLNCYSQPALNLLKKGEQCNIYRNMDRIDEPICRVFSFFFSPTAVCSTWASVVYWKAIGYMDSYVEGFIV